MTTSEYIKAVEKYENLIYTICWNFTKNHHTAQDLAQDAFVSAFLNKESCTGEPKSWLSRIAVNKCKDHLKSAYIRNVSPCCEDYQFESSQLYHIEQSTQNIIEQQETQKHVQNNIQNLPELYSNIAKLYFINQYSVAEIAQMINRPKRTVHTQLYRAKFQLRTQLASLQNENCYC